MLTSNGWGGGFSYAKMKTIFHKNLWNFELVTIHDPKEYKQNPSSYDGRRFVYGKKNAFWNFRSQWGFQNQLYAKRDKGGIEIRYYLIPGIDLGFLKPVYYNFSDGKVRKFTVQHSATIIGRAPFYKGFNELHIIPGATITLGSSFEFSKRDRIINALEGGLTFDLFPKEVVLMANDYNKMWFLSFFISYKFGKVVNPRISDKPSPEKTG
jgi:hypothetical protein